MQACFQLGGLLRNQCATVLCKQWGQQGSIGSDINACAIPQEAIFHMQVQLL
jgi:hypothetical protein